MKSRVFVKDQITALAMSEISVNHYKFVTGFCNGKHIHINMYNCSILTVDLLYS